MISSSVVCDAALAVPAVVITVPGLAKSDSPGWATTVLSATVISWTALCNYPIRQCKMEGSEVGRFYRLIYNRRQILVAEINKKVSCTQNEQRVQYL